MVGGDTRAAAHHREALYGGNLGVAGVPLLVDAGPPLSNPYFPPHSAISTQIIFPYKSTKYHTRGIKIPICSDCAPRKNPPSLQQENKSNHMERFKGIET
jgi:hypothetical protein